MSMDTHLSRPERGILAPASESNINIGHELSLPSKKRKLGDECNLLAPWSPFPINILTPILLLPRAHLPLSWLDNDTSSAASPCTRLFTARIRCLDPEILKYKHISILSVLIATLEIDGSLVAIERVEEDIYALCRLGNWVTSDQLQAAAPLARDDPPHRWQKVVKVGEGLDWYEAAKADPSRLPARKRIKIVENNTTEVSTITEPVHASLHCEEGSLSFRPPAELETSISSEPPRELHSTNDVPDAVTELTSQDVFEMVQMQYLESLYISKTSLAYFAKGPLSRARASFQRNESLETIEELASFLRSLVLTLNVMDKKYRDPLPKIVQSLPPGDVSDDQMDDQTGQRHKKSKNRKKLSRGKDGLHTEEERYISKWWRGNYDDSTTMSVEETRDQLIKKRLASLRTRETKLQIILILEVLALEMTLSKGDRVTVDQKVETVNPKEGKGKKKQDLHLVLELLVDRLCIWQSVNNEDPSGGDTRTSSEFTLVRGQDDLRDFCVEVIVPFYAARIPEKCAAINQKLGGPSIPSPVRPSKSSKFAVGKSIKRPGLISKRSLPEVSRRKFERVVTDERLARVKDDSQRPSRPPPPLTRAATLPAVPALKRERTGTPIPMSEIPTKGSRQMSVSRSGVLNSKELRQREVDLSVIANKKGVEAKSKKNSQIETELKGAITALRKPNRGLAVKDYVESCESRTLNGGSNVKRSRKWTGSITARSVQVEATPRRKNKMAMTRAVFPVSEQAVLDETNCVPSSSLPPQIQNMHSEQQDMISPVARRTLPTVQDTPCRGLSKFTRIPSSTRRTQEQAPFTSPSRVSYEETSLSTIMNTNAIVSETPAGRAWKRSQKLIVESHVTKQEEVEERSTEEEDVRMRQVTVMASATTTTMRRIEVDNERSIYENLGWEDELDELA
ncbi:MAG: hypothetical protein M1816_004409 [Peltula sp. TS41687]|nr:MAG: hypothetical protein M1816_004409 [Peltula sp. TS41687]